MLSDCTAMNKKCCKQLQIDLPRKRIKLKIALQMNSNPCGDLHVQLPADVETWKVSEKGGTSDLIAPNPDFDGFFWLFVLHE